MEERERGTLHNAFYPKPRRMLTVNVSIHGSHSIEALIDGGAEINAISPTLAKEHDLTIEPLPNLIAEGANGVKLTIHGLSMVTMDITDSRGRTQRHLIPFVVADIPRYQVYLGLPWIDDHNPKLSYASRRMLFRGSPIKDRPKFEHISIEDAEQFDKTLRGSKVDVYACSVGLVGQLDPIAADKPSVPIHYIHYIDLGSEENATAIPDHGPQDLSITITEGEQPPFKPLYNLSATELQVLRKYLTEYLSRGWIRRSKSPAGAPILFAKKKDGSLRLCVDYRGLNKITIKNRCPLPLITESLERLSQAKIYTKLDIREAYHRIRIKEGDEWKTAFRTRYGHYEYTVMPFGLTNAPAQFQAYMNQALAGLIDITCIVYLDDILVFSDNEEDHIRHVKEVLDRLREFKLYVKLDKCEWHTDRTEYLGYIIAPEGVSIDPSRVQTIQEWPMPQTVRDIRVFIGFMNYYRRFISGFSKLALPLTKLTQKGPNSAKGGRAQRREESQKLHLSPDAKDSFQHMKDAFLGVPILCHYDPTRETRVEVDASGGAIAGILSQNISNDAAKPDWRPVDFYSRKLIDAEYRYDTHDQELLAIVKSLENWRHYLEGIPFELLTDHQNLKWFMETKVLNSRQVRSYLILSKYDFVLTHRPGRTNPADGPSRRPDYMAQTQDPSLKKNESFVKPLREILSKTHHEDPNLILAVTTRSSEGKTPAPVVDRSTLADIMEDLDDDDHDLPIEERGTTYSSEEHTSDDSMDEEAPVGQASNKANQSHKIRPETAGEKSKALQECHNNPMAGHFGARRTLEKLSRHYTWKGMTKDVKDYCHDCLRCRRSATAKHKPYGLLAPLHPPSSPWEEVTMDFITELPPSKLSGVTYDSILVVVCRLTKMAHYIPARSDWDGIDLAQSWIREIIRLHGVPTRIISDRGPLMNAKHWKTFNYYLNSKRVLTSAYHPQTDGQTERQNQTLEQYLRCFCSLEQDDWSLWISTAEFAYNDSVHATTNTTPFQANLGLNPRSAEWPKIPLGDDESPAGADFAKRLRDVQSQCKANIIKANEYSKKYADKKRLPIPFKVGDQVLLSTRNIKSTRPKKKLDWKYLGPGKIVAQIGPSAFKLDMPGLINIHPVFHASLLEPYDPKGEINHLEPPIQETLLTGGEDVYEVDYIADRRKNKQGEWEYFIKWKNYPESSNTWEPTTNITANPLKTYWDKVKAAPKRKYGPPSANDGHQGRRPKRKEGNLS